MDTQTVNGYITLHTGVAPYLSCILTDRPFLTASFKSANIVLGTESRMNLHTSSV